MEKSSAISPTNLSAGEPAHQLVSLNWSRSLSPPDSADVYIRASKGLWQSTPWSKNTPWGQAWTKSLPEGILNGPPLSSEGMKPWQYQNLHDLHLPYSPQGPGRPSTLYRLQQHPQHLKFGVGHGGGQGSSLRGNIRDREGGQIGQNWRKSGQFMGKFLVKSIYFFVGGLSGAIAESCGWQNLCVDGESCGTGLVSPGGENENEIVHPGQYMAEFIHATDVDISPLKSYDPNLAGSTPGNPPRWTGDTYHDPRPAFTAYEPHTYGQPSPYRPPVSPYASSPYELSPYGLSPYASPSYASPPYAPSCTPYAPSSFLLPLCDQATIMHSVAVESRLGGGGNRGSCPGGRPDGGPLEGGQPQAERLDGGRRDFVDKRQWRQWRGRSREDVAWDAAMQRECADSDSERSRETGHDRGRRRSPSVVVLPQPTDLQSTSKRNDCESEFEAKRPLKPSPASTASSRAPSSHSPAFNQRGDGTSDEMDTERRHLS